MVIENQSLGQLENTEIRRAFPVHKVVSGTYDDYTPQFEEKGEVKAHLWHGGLGIFEQNGKFYFSSCNPIIPQETYLIPKKLADYISDYVNSTKATEKNELIHGLWGAGSEGGRKEKLKEILDSLK